MSAFRCMLQGPQKCSNRLHRFHAGHFSMGHCCGSSQSGPCPEIAAPGLQNADCIPRLTPRKFGGSKQFGAHEPKVAAACNHHSTDYHVQFHMGQVSNARQHTHAQVALRAMSPNGRVEWTGAMVASLARCGNASKRRWAGCIFSWRRGYQGSSTLAHTYALRRAAAACWSEVTVRRIARHTLRSGSQWSSGTHSSGTPQERCTARQMDHGPS